ncbi:MAG: aminodeoxychorismate synthase component I [Armatimonadetes bacterium]|nr:aminodeoxychorismate synthase component I [Armatimonadota bacterium]
MAPLSPQDITVEPIPGRLTDLFRQLKVLPYAFWLDSAGAPSPTARWSFMGAEPFAIMEAGEATTRLWRDGAVRTFNEDPLDHLQKFMAEFSLPPQAGTPPFIGGAVGWFGYDLARRWEQLPEAAEDDTRLPCFRLAFYDTIYACDHESDRLWRVTRRDLAKTVNAIQTPSSVKDSAGYPPFPSQVGTPCGRETFSREGYLRAIERIKEYIAAGDIYQANLTQRFARPFSADPSELFLQLRRVNPAPFSAFLDFGDVTVLSASPERFLRLDAATRRVETRPIKGTRPRSPDPEMDRGYAAELLKSEKDRAENLMIVDVHRNDLGRVCEIGSVRVPVLRGLESYATVHHLVSVVEGRLRPDCAPLDLFRAAFPAGSITGAPKLRAMEIIEELEPVRRGIYTGSIGYLGWDGGMDLSVAIRTLVAQGGAVHYGVGGGIVADSDPEAEYQETLVKAGGLERALDL